MVGWFRWHILIWVYGSKISCELAGRRLVFKRMELDGKKRTAIVHLILDSNQHSSEGNFVLIPSITEGVVQNIEMANAAIECFLTEATSTFKLVEGGVVDFVGVRVRCQILLLRNNFLYKYCTYLPVRRTS